MHARSVRTLTLGFAWVGLFLGLIGCGTTAGRTLMFLGEQVQPGAPSPSGSSGESAGPEHHERPATLLTAQGWLVTRPEGPGISLEISNHGTAPVRFSYVSDEYLGMTREGRTVVLEKGDFFHYPDVLHPGEERSVFLLVPRDPTVHELSHLLVKCNLGNTILILESIDPTRPMAPSMENGTLIRAQTPVSRDAVIAVPHPPVALPPVTPTDLGVPVDVEYQQALGTVLKLEVRWNDEPISTFLMSGERRTFAVAAGRHTLHVTSELPRIATTHGDLPVVVTPGKPLRVRVEARATLIGVELHVRAWQEGSLLWDQTLTPSALQ